MRTSPDAYAAAPARRRAQGCAVYAALGMLSVAAPALSSTAQQPRHPASERALWRLWQVHAEAPERHAENVNACRVYIDTYRDQELKVVAESLAAWHLLQLDRPEDARQLLEPHLSAYELPLLKSADHLARTWLSRMDMELVKLSLQSYYRREVRYPETLEQLASHPRLPSDSHPAADRWGRAWTYRTRGLDTLEGFHAQRYSLESPSLGEKSNLSMALRRPYAGGIRIEPDRVEQAGERALVRFRATDASGQLSSTAPLVELGKEFDGVFVAYVGQHIIVVRDREHWKLFPTPAP